MSRLFVVYGPSGVGKSSVVAAALANDTCARAKQVVTCTTRLPRAGEVDGEHYYFVSKHKFESFISSGALVEWSEAYGTYYGVLRDSINEILGRGFSAVVLLDRLGVESVKRAFPAAYVIFLAPPSFDVLRQRLLARGSNTVEEIEQRLRLAQQELAAEEARPLADIAVENADFQVTVAHIQAIICEKV